jgi:NDP-sugar pyrophosphorylase family protein
MQVIIPLSGLGQRFVDAGYSNIKPLININGKPIIEYVISLFNKDEDDFVFIVNELYASTTDVITQIADIVPNAIIITIPVHKLGPVYAVAQVYNHIDANKPCIVSYCDFYMQWNYNDFKQFVATTNCDAAMPSYKGFHPHLLHPHNVYAGCKVKDGHQIVEIKEKYSFAANKAEAYHSVGVYYFKSGALMQQYSDQLMQAQVAIQGEYYTSLVLQQMIEDNLQVNVYDAIPYVCQWGTPFDLEEYLWWQDVFLNEKIVAPKRNFNQQTTVIMPMAGNGQRFVDVGYNTPKALLPILNKPMFLSAINCLPLASNYIFITKQNIDNSLLPYNSTIITVQNTTQGQANSALLATSNIDPEQPVMIIPCDNGMQYNIEKFLQLTNTADVIVTTFKNSYSVINNAHQYSWAKVDDYNNITTISCKKAISATPYNDQALTGAFWFKKAAFFTEYTNKMIEENNTINNEYYIDNVINYCIAGNLKVVSFVLDKYIGWGTPYDYETYTYWNNFFKNNVI